MARLSERAMRILMTSASATLGRSAAPAAMLALAACATAVPTPEPTFAEAYAAAAAAPKSRARLDTLWRALARKGYCDAAAVRCAVESDLVLTREEAGAYFRERFAAAEKIPEKEKAEAGAFELSLNVRNGTRDTWPRRLQAMTYAVDRQTFASAPPGAYERAVEMMAYAAGGWREICAECEISFTHLREKDAAPRHADGLTFIVRYEAQGNGATASSFYPHRILNDARTAIDPFRQKNNGYLEIHQPFFQEQETAEYKYYTRPISWTHEGVARRTYVMQDGVLRHELGHILGYRHEFANAVPTADPAFQGCETVIREEAGAAGGQALLLQAGGKADPKSVMMYPCGRISYHQTVRPVIGDSDRYPMAFSPCDEALHRHVYGKGDRDVAACLR